MMSWVPNMLHFFGKSVPVDVFVLSSGLVGVVEIDYEYEYCAFGRV